MCSSDLTCENDVGEYAVRVMHPDQSAKPVHGRFWVERLSVDYNRFRLFSGFLGFCHAVCADPKLKKVLC